MHSSGDHHYRIVFVDEDELPPIRDFVFIEHDSEVVLAIKVSKVLPRVLEDAWETYREMTEREMINA